MNPNSLIMNSFLHRKLYQEEWLEYLKGGLENPKLFYRSKSKDIRCRDVSSWNPSNRNTL
jgi:hypothetical protein